MDGSISESFATMPITVEILSILSDVSIKMRCDRNVSVLSEKKIETTTMDSQKFRRIQLVWGKIEQLIYRQETVVHGDPDSMHKLLLTISRDKEDGLTFFHIGIEELWNPNIILANDDIIALNFVHAKYFPSKHMFTHIDFSVNQYKKEIYTLKYADASNNQHISVNQYSDIHYKIWCVEGSGIEVGVWSSLVSATLNMPFRKLFKKCSQMKKRDDS